MRSLRPFDDFNPSSFFVLRTPLLPFDLFLNWCAVIPTIASDPGGDSRSPTVQEPSVLRQRLREIILRPAVREALFLASPDFEDSLKVWISRPESDHGKRLEPALVRYFARMTGRPTPFGLFAGCSVGTLGPSTRLRLPPAESYRRHARLDMDYLCSMSRALADSPSLRHRLLYRPNNTLYRSGGKLRYVESHWENQRRRYQLVAVEPTDYLESVLTRAQSGASISNLMESLLETESDVSRDEALSYLDSLADSQILVPDLIPTVTGPEPIYRIMQDLGPHPDCLETVRTLENVSHALDQLNSTGLGCDPLHYRSLARDLASLPGSFNLSRLFQVDLHKPTEDLSLGKDVVDEIAGGISLLHRMTPLSGATFLKTLREAFVQRYERREVPLVEVLDEETGIGFEQISALAADPSPLLAGLNFPETGGVSRPWTARDAFLLSKLEALIRSGGLELELDESDLATLDSKNPLPLPDSFCAMGTLYASSVHDLNAGNFRIYLLGASGPPGVRMMGRFCHGDPVLKRFVESHLRSEEAARPDSVFAEIVHLPEERIGNILCRPTLRGYEIPYLGRSSVQPANQIPLTDILVSVAGGQFVLRSARLERIIIPRLTAAHNYHLRNLPAYAFLCLLQEQSTSSGVFWNWGALASCAFLPRVRMGRLVLSQARWRLSRTEVKQLADARSANRPEAIQAWRQSRSLPRLVCLAESENLLPVDLANPLSIDSFLDLVKHRAEVQVTELFPGADDLVACSDEGRFLHEFHIPFVRNPDSRRVSVDRSFAVQPLSHIRHPPGSEWLYVKLYGGAAHADEVLRGVIEPVVHWALKKSIADRWFFVRYQDPDHHTRLRFHGTPDRLHSELLPRINRACDGPFRENLIWRIQLDTYDPEIERYGGPESLAIAEELFWVDSESALAVISEFFGEGGLDARWRIALLGIHGMLLDFGLGLAQRERLMERVHDGLAREFAVNKALKIEIGNKYRRERRSIEEMLELARVGFDAVPGGRILQERSRRWTPAIRRLQTLSETLPADWLYDGFIPSLIHMSMNRILRSAHRAQEMVLYDYLRRAYRSQRVRAEPR